MIKNILLFLLCTTITISGSEQEKIIVLFQQVYANKVTIQGGLAPLTLFKSQSDGNFTQTTEVKCVYIDLQAAVGFSIPGVQEHMRRELPFVNYVVSDHALFCYFHRYANDRFYLQDSCLENAMQGYLAPLEVKD